MHDAYAAFRYRDYSLFSLGVLAHNFGHQAQGVAVGWELYERSDSALVLGLVGLVQVLPVFALALPAGHLADRVDRRLIVVWTMLLSAVSSLGLAWASSTGAGVGWTYVCLLASAVSTSFNMPARASLLPQLVPVEAYANAVAWRSSGFQAATVAGPAMGGALIGITGSAVTVYLVDAGAAVVCLITMLLLRPQPTERVKEEITLRSLLAGVTFVWRSKLVLGAISLDMIAVLLGGAETLLPIYARDILHVGPTGLGWLRAAPAIGALVTSVIVAHLPPFKRAGRALLLTIAGFGVATIVFGVSTSFTLSFAALLLTGVFDNVSVVIRHTLVQTATPDAMRGRVSAVNTVFIATSNQLGGFESGLVAFLVSPVFSVVSGGVGTIAVVLLAAWLFPQLRRLRTLREAAV